MKLPRFVKDGKTNIRNGKKEEKHEKHLCFIYNKKVKEIIGQ